MVELVLSGTEPGTIVTNVIGIHAYTSTERDSVAMVVSCNAWNVYIYVMNWIIVASIKLLKQPRSCLLWSAPRCMQPAHALCRH